MTVVAPDLDDTIEGFLWVARYERSLAENTIEAYHRDLQALRDYLAAEQGTTRLHGITTEHLRAWMLHLADLGLARSTVARHRSSMRQLFAYVSGPHRFDGVAIYRQADRDAPFEVMQRFGFSAQAAASPA